MILFRVGGLTIHAYGVAMTLAFIGTLIYFYHYGEKVGYTRYEAVEIGALSYFFSLFMSHIVNVLLNFKSYRLHWHRILYLFSGRSWHGDLIGFMLLVLIYSHIKKYPPGQGMDLVFTGSMLALAIGRIGCTLSGCCYGLSTDLPWGITYPPGHPSTGPIHPVQVYELILDLALFVFLVRRFDRRRFAGENTLLMFALYSAIRFTVEFFRFNPPSQIHGPLTTAQWASIGIISVTVPALFILRKKLPPPGTNNPEASLIKND